MSDMHWGGIPGYGDGDLDGATAQDESMGHDEIDIEEIDHSRGTRGEFSWRDVSLVADFALRFQSSDPSWRAAFREVMNVHEDTDVIDVASTIYPPGGRKSAVEFLQDLIRRHNEGELGFAAGAALTSQLAAMDVETVRTITKILDTLSERYAEEGIETEPFRYRKNMSSNDVVMRMIDIIGQLTKEASQLLDWVSDLLAIWPGEAL